VFAYSDVKHEYVMSKGSEVMAAGANFLLLGPDATMLDAEVPVVAVTAVRTGVGKSQTTRAIAGALKDLGKRVVAVRHPMPYGDLEAQRVQRYATLEDLDRYDCTIEEREEYEPHIMSGTIIYAGVDYGEILRRRRPRPTCCCGTAATTTCRSTGRPCTSRSSTRCGPVTSSAITRARRTCAWPTWSS
jgi:predicted GTPase